MTSHPDPIPPVLQSQSMTAHADSLRAIANHLSELSAKIKRLSEAHERVVHALQSEAPEGMSRIDWIARKLNEGNDSYDI